MSPAHLLHVFFARLLPLVLLALLGARAMAQADPPSRVGRVNLAEGAVAFSQAGDNEWTDAIRNRPLTRGDRVWTERRSRAEMQVGSSAVRMAPSTHVEILQLDDRAAQLSVTQGSVYVRIRTLPEGENFEIDTPNLAYRAAYPGDYRIDVDPVRGITRVTIHSGTGAVYGEAGQVLPLGGGQQITFRDRTLAQVSVQESPPQDNFDRWAADRNRREEQSVSARYVPREVVGYQELDSAGQWSQDATHGSVWFPQGMPANWAPYRNGHWEWMSPWGWTWMDDAAWGFAPFHYGRWAMIGSRWAWVPGRLSLKPVYAPALVAFVGGGNGSATQWNLPVIAGKPGVAWFPLAPGEVWQPGYRASPVYMSNLNQNLKLEANPTYANQRKPEALTSIPAEEFHRGKPAGAGWLRIAANSLTNAQIVPPPPMPERGGTIAMSRVAPAKVTVPQPDTPPAPRRVAAPATQVAVAPASQPKPASEPKPATQAAVQAAALAQAAAHAARVQAAAQQQAEVQRVLQAAQQQRAEAERARQQQAKAAVPVVAAAKAPAAPPVVAAAVPAVLPAVQPQAAAPAKRAEAAKAEVVNSEMAKAEVAKAEKAKAEIAKAARATAERAKAERAKAAEQARIEQAKLEQDRAEEQARREKQARRAEQSKREQLARRAEARREQIAETKREQLAAAKREQIAAAKQAKLAEAQAKRELVAKREREQAAKRELLARQAEQAKREQSAKRAELQREQTAKRAEQLKREQLAKQAEQAKREAVARREEQQRRELHAQHVEQARRSAERDAQALREQRMQREEQQAKREAQERQERELAQQQAQRAAIARQQQALAEQWRRDQQAWEQQQQQLRLRGGRPDLRDDRRSRGIPILNSGPMS
ncbi:DUF6600 domain-containing protein [Ramlibacter sp. WS9]|uniref:DUF6600 domain-containing protein n=1 Tax=Ramlibacter sp. WS9 TaxID=1882741 RepID=UPI001144A506|nr:DUF6600 domain-containing protein [Ramlibacter sp. WS9]